MVTNTGNLSSWEAEPGEQLKVQGQPGPDTGVYTKPRLQKETLSEKESVGGRGGRGKERGRDKERERGREGGRIRK